MKRVINEEQFYSTEYRTGVSSVVNTLTSGLYTRLTLEGNRFIWVGCTDFQSEELEKMYQEKLIKNQNYEPVGKN